MTRHPEAREHDAANSTCARCAAPVIRRDDDRLLDPQPTPWGMQLLDGGTLTARRLGRQIHGAVQPEGHATHRCGRGAAEQQGLFDMPAGVERGGVR